MTTEQKQVKAKPALKEVVAEGAEKLGQASKEAQQNVTQAMSESAENVKAEAKEVQADVQVQVLNL